MNPLVLLMPRRIGFSTDTPRWSKPDVLGFLLMLLAGGRTVVLNADIRGGTLHLPSGRGVRVVNTSFSHPANTESSQ